MERRTFIRSTILGSLAAGLSGFMPKNKTHILTLSFDDGFKKSFHQTADIFERYNLRACLNVIASGHLTKFNVPNSYHKDERGDFDDWNALQKRGHEIMPHSWDHSHIAQIPLEEAKEDILKCMQYFEENLEGFNASKAVYNFAYNESNQDLDQFALTKFRAVRTQGDTALNPIPVNTSPVRLGCWSYGPGNADKWVDQQVNEFIAGKGGWLILNLHGLDDEGWGPVSSQFLDELLKRLVKLDYLEILPAGIVLSRSQNI
jgi:peptidoglycan/xylan/chitin deacetylase (PgdA/CDA1 family)